MTRPARFAPARPVILVAAVALAAACKRTGEPDAYGTFETRDVVVSAETSGRLLRFAPAEGDRLAAGQVVGLVDTAQLVLERQQVVAQRRAADARAVEVTRNIAVLETEREIARRTYERVRRLYTQQAATAPQLDQAERDYRALGERIAAAQAGRRTASQDVATSEARVAQIAERLRKSRVANPIAGTVLATYAEAGEFVQPGQPLYKIANLDSMVLRAYVAEPELARVRVGQRVQVTIDSGRRVRRTLPGIITWVSSEAEFTPTPIQTREERADLVYAVKIRVPNDSGVVKVGMPADVRFSTGLTRR